MRSFAEAPSVKDTDRRAEGLPRRTISDARSVGEYRSIRWRHAKAAAALAHRPIRSGALNFATGGSRPMKLSRSRWLGLLACIAAMAATSMPASAQQQQKPNILFIMADDFGWMPPRISPRGLMFGETPNTGRIANEGALFTDSSAEQSCTAGGNPFFPGMPPLRTGLIPPQLPGSPSYLRPGTPALAKFL